MDPKIGDRFRIFYGKPPPPSKKGKSLTSYFTIRMGNLKAQFTSTAQFSNGLGFHKK